MGTRMRILWLVAIIGYMFCLYFQYLPSFTRSAFYAPCSIYSTASSQINKYIYHEFHLNKFFYGKTWMSGNTLKVLKEMGIKRLYYINEGKIFTCNIIGFMFDVRLVCFTLMKNDWKIDDSCLKSTTMMIDWHEQIRI